MEWAGQLIWNEKDASQQEVGPTLWHYAMILTLDFQGQIMK